MKMNVKNLKIIQHALVQHKLSVLRDKETRPKDFREVLKEVSALMFYEVTRSVATKAVRIKTPLGMSQGRIVSGKMICLVPILRAGLGMAEGIHPLLPQSRIGHIGLYRDPKTLLPVDYFIKLPRDIDKRLVVLLDPMLATGNSLVEAINILKKENVKKIIFLGILAAPEGIKVVHKYHPEVPLYLAAVDKRLNSHGYIIPGLGDAGDRLFGTK